MSRKPVLLRLQGGYTRRFDSSLASRPKMILTTCAACAAPLAHDAPRCIRCKMRYCDTLIAANNYAYALARLERSEEARSLLRKTIPVVRRSRGENSENTLRMRGLYATAVYLDEGATLDDLREAVTTLEETERTARRVLGGAHPLTTLTEGHLGLAREALRTRESTGDVESLREAVEAMTPPGDA